MEGVYINGSKGEQTQYNNTIETRYALGKGEYLTSEYYRQLLKAGYYATESKLYYNLYSPTGERVFKQNTNVC
jgi:hypothetical protein